MQPEITAWNLLDGVEVYYTFQEVFYLYRKLHNTQKMDNNAERLKKEQHEQGNGIGCGYGYGSGCDCVVGISWIFSTCC